MALKQDTPQILSILVIQMSCLLICSLLNVSLFVEKTIFFLIPARIVQQYRQKSFLRFLMQQNSFFRHMNRLVYMKNWFEKGHSSHSLDEVINSASIKLGYSLVFWRQEIPYPVIFYINSGYG